MSRIYTLFINIIHINAKIQINFTVYIVYRGNPILFLIDKNFEKERKKLVLKKLVKKTSVPKRKIFKKKVKPFVQNH